MKSINGQLKEKVAKIVYDRGKQCCKKKQGLINTLIADGNFITIEADFMESNEKIKSSIIIAQKDGEYIEGTCNCLDFKQRKNICKHIVALGIQSDKTKDVLEIIGTDELVMKFEDDFDNIIEEIEEKPKTKKKKNSNSLKTKEDKVTIEKIGEIEEIENKKEVLESISENTRKKENNFENIEVEKRELQLEVEIDEESYSDYRYGYDYDRDDFVPGYVLRLKIGLEKTYYIKDIIKFVTSVINNEEYAITNKFFYNPNIYYFSEMNYKIIEKLNEFQEKISKTDIIIRDKKGLKIVENLYDEILDIIDNNKKIYILEKMVQKMDKYEPLFIKHKNKIKFRKINRICSNSNYFSFENDDTRMYKMENKEKKLLEKIGIDIEYLDELLETNEKLKQELIDENIQMAEYIDEVGSIQLYVKEWNKNLLNIKLSNIVQVIEKDNKYYIPKINKELLRTLSKIIEKNSIIEMGINEENTYVVDYDGLGIISEIIDKKYSNKVEIQLDNNIKKARNISVSFNVKKASNGLLDFAFNIEGIKEVDVDLVIEGIKSEKTYITLTSGELVKIVNKSIEELLGVVDSISNLKLGNNKISKIKALQLAQISKNIKEDLDEIDEFKKLFNKIKEKKEVDPKNIKVNLFPYQKLGFNWLKNMYDIGLGAVLADDMGLGKTLQTITTLNELKNENKDFLGIVVVPTSLLHNWKEEIIKFSDIIPNLIEGTSKKRKDMIKEIKKGILITTYQALRNDIEEYKEKKFDIVILDEAQNIKTTTSQIKKAVMKLDSKVNFALTGTPVENNVLELWSIFDFVLPGYLDTLSKFKKNYKEILVNPNSKKIGNLRNIIAPFILRRTKKEVLKELPEKFETNIVVQLSEEQKQLYLSYIKKAKKEISKFNKKENNRMKILAILTKLRQICNSPMLFKEDYHGEVAKIEVLKDLMPDIVENGHRLLIFSQFVGTLKEIEKELQNQGVEYFYIDGSVKSRERMEICKRFNGGQKQVVLISLKAGGTGLNLVGADVVIHYDPWWNIAVENQASDRAYRIGQKNSVQVIKLVTEGTIEEKIIKIQENKKILSENLLEGQGSEKVLFEMTDDELMGLLS